MGIHKLKDFLKDTCPNAFEKIHISEYSYKKIAIDVSLYMCKYKYAYLDHWLSAFLNLVACLRKYEVHCVFIYDTGSPKEKEKERQRRVAQREKDKNYVISLEDAFKQYIENDTLDPILIDFYKNIKADGKLSNEMNVDILQKEIETRRKRIDIKILTKFSLSVN